MREEFNKVDFLRHVGLARKAGKVVLGSDNVYEKMHSGSVCLVIVSREASENTKKKLENRAKYTKTDIYSIDVSVQELGKSVGTELASCVGITDINFKNLLTKSFNSFEE
ncbi:MAG: ribosomal L7Ae/L30e/S12e/Gadd45 family protein [Clostridiales bacterium]|nr:ribosomal L7Ae/L30e/S12e/Gadd45 family protein [Clostridiales bacterium]